MDYAALLGLLVGLSVIIPYIGAALVTIPVLVVAFFQWGLTDDFYWVAFSYAVIQALDGNVLVPLLFSEAVNLHPIAIIVAVLFFGAPKNRTATMIAIGCRLTASLKSRGTSTLPSSAWITA